MYSLHVSRARVRITARALCRSTHVRAQNQLAGPMKVSVEVVPEQTVSDEIAGRPVADGFVVPVGPNPVSEYLRRERERKQQQHT